MKINFKCMLCLLLLIANSFNAAIAQVSNGDGLNPIGGISQNTQGIVKKSKTGICHAPGSTFYTRTEHFTAYKTLDECLKSSGRLPKR